MDTNTKIIVFLLLPLAGYLLGAIPFGYLIGRAHGVDVRTAGSGNIGSTNVGRILGRKWGILCFFLDVGKGFLPVWWAGRYLYEVQGPAESTGLSVHLQLAWLLAAAACIVGHMFSVYLRFRGGKGVATSLGAVLGVWPYFTLTGVIVFLIWAAVWGTWRYVSLASITAALAFPLTFVMLIWRVDRPEWQFSQLTPLFIFSCLMAGLVLLRHRGNIRRLLDGTESRGGNKVKTNIATADTSTKTDHDS
jgi:glycerol-3-phosphate acyltransferase PlsY